ncbi:MAG: vWA domain-containing protein, partial [Candidatus Acidiferrales bacterium]
MFEFLFKYPASIFSKGEFVLLGGWPKWFLLLLVLATAVGLAVLIRARLPKAAAPIRNWRAGIIWFLEFFLATVVLVLLWQPAITVAELKPQQNIIAVLVDDSRSMAIADQGAPRETQAAKALQDGTLAELQKKFQTRLYRLDTHLTRIADSKELQAAPAAPATRINDGLKQLASETADLPVGAVVLLSDGSDNTGGIDADTISALRNRRIPVHTVGFGLEQTPNDVEINDAVVAPRALADSRLSARVSFHQRGFAGRKSTLSVRDGDKVLAAREVVFASDDKIQTEDLLFNAGSAGAKTLQFSLEPLQGE